MINMCMSWCRLTNNNPMMFSTHTKAYRVVLTGVVLGWLLTAPHTFALSSTNYQITADSINFVGTENTASTNYGLRDSGGEVATGDSSGVLYSIKAGYRQMLGVITGSSGSSGSSDSGSGGSSSGGGGILPQSAFAVQSVTVASGATVLLFDVSLNQPGKAVFVWGVSTLYDGGTLASDSFQQNHVFKLENLVPGTTYYFAVQAMNEIGSQAGQIRQSATTLATVDTTAPANPLRLVVEPSVIGSKLSWEHPVGGDIELVKVVRSTEFYPTDPDEGEVVYEGRGTSALDTTLQSGKTYYYTLFTKDVSGNYSSGAIAKMYRARPGETVYPESSDVFVNAEPAPTVDPRFNLLTILDFLITQDNKMAIDDTGKILLDGGEQFKIALDYTKVPEVLKTMVVSIKDKARPDEVFTFLLRVNDDKTKYEALVDKLGRGGNFALAISILDHKHRGITQLAGDLVVSAPKQLSLFSRFLQDPIGSVQRVSIFWWIGLVVLIGVIGRIARSSVLP